MASYEIYRGAGERPWEVRFEKFASVESTKQAYEDGQLPFGQMYYYFVRGVDRSGRPGQPSLKVRTEPRVVDDVVVSVIDANRIEVSWNAPPGDDIAGYTIERAQVEVLCDDQLKRLKAQTPPLEIPSVGAVRRIGPFEPITPAAAPLRQTTFANTSIDLARRAALSGEPIEERKFNDEQFDPSNDSSVAARLSPAATPFARLRARRPAANHCGASQPQRILPACGAEAGEVRRGLCTSVPLGFSRFRRWRVRYAVS
ncbi:MAG: hypothetical protein HYS13_19270 [Planctomycetia bacterium]|nr:hypothetical protein [Planctomycetia bacterium]